MVLKVEIHDLFIAYVSCFQTDIDEALLLSASSEEATNLILGRVHPAAILQQSSAELRSSQADSQPTETASSTLVQGQQSSERHMAAESQDAATVTSLSLASEEGGEGSADGLEVSEEILEVSEEVSEEDQAGSFPSEVESDSHRDDDNLRYDGQLTHQPSRSSTVVSDETRSAERAGIGMDRRSVGGILRETSCFRTRETKDVAARDVAWNLQRDSGRSSSHSDYLDDYLELLTSRCNSGLGLEGNVLSVTTCKAAAPVTTSTVTSKVSTTNVADTFRRGSGSSASGVESYKRDNISSSLGVSVGTQNDKEHGNPYLNPRSSEVKMSDDDKLSPKKDRIAEEYNGYKKEALEITEGHGELRSPRELHRARDILSEPRSSSAASERRVSKKHRARRWSSAQPLDPGRSVGSK